MSKTDTGKYFAVRITGDFEKHITDLAAKFDRSKASAIRYCVKRVYEEEFPANSQPAQIGTPPD